VNSAKAQVAGWRKSGCNIVGEHAPHITCPGLSRTAFLLNAARSSERYAHRLRIDLAREIAIRGGAVRQAAHKP